MPTHAITSAALHRFHCIVELQQVRAGRLRICFGKGGLVGHQLAGTHQRLMSRVGREIRKFSFYRDRGGKADLWRPILQILREISFYSHLIIIIIVIV